jgi:hypothetical protein
MALGLHKEFAAAYSCRSLGFWKPSTCTSAIVSIRTALHAPVMVVDSNSSTEFQSPGKPSTESAPSALDRRSLCRAIRFTG